MLIGCELNMGAERNTLDLGTILQKDENLYMKMGKEVKGVY